MKKLLVLTSNILNDFSPAGISVEVSCLGANYKKTTLLPWQLNTC